MTPLVRGTCSNLEDLAKIHVETLVARFSAEKLRALKMTRASKADVSATAHI